MTHYWGAKAICDRIGYRKPGRLPELIIRYQLPAYKRPHPKKHCIPTYYSNEAMLSKWDLARAQSYRDELLAKQERKKLAAAEKEKYGPRGLKK